MSGIRDVLKPLAEGAKAGWKLFVDGQEVSAKEMELVSKFGTVRWGATPLGMINGGLRSRVVEDQCWCRSQRWMGSHGSVCWTAAAFLTDQFSNAGVARLLAHLKLFGPK